jgi:phosphatidylglycerophosphate synthase
MSPNFDHVIILADESADWKIAGLRQLERLVLALDELATSISSQRQIDIFIFWRPDIAVEQRWQPQNPRLTRCNFVDSLVVGGRERVFNTRLLLKRRSLEQFAHDVVPLENDATIGDESAVWEKLWRRFEDGSVNSSVSRQSESWRYVAGATEIARAERWLLRGSGKTRDGIVSRYLNRPISRAVSRFLLKTSITPNIWTWLITLFPVIGFFFLTRGHYSGFVIGAALFQIHSVLDGCDGEIARAKYLDSEKGPGLDALGDLIALLLFSLGLGVGLFRTSGGDGLPDWIFLTEGLLSFLFIGARLGPHTFDLLNRGPAAVVSSAHDESLRTSGRRIFGARITSLTFELTKRDVVYLLFLVLAMLGWTQSILHLLFVYSIATLLLRQGGVPRGSTAAP